MIQNFPSINRDVKSGEIRPFGSNSSGIEKDIKYMLHLSALIDRFSANKKAQRILLCKVVLVKMSEDPPSCKITHF